MAISNDMTWTTHLYGNKKTGSDKIQGLIPQLAQRIGVLKQLEKLMPRNLLRNTCSGLFTSKLLYGIQLYSNVWGLSDMDESNRRFKAFTKEDSRRLQVLQNKILRIILKNPDCKTPTRELLNELAELSVHQLGALHTLQTVFEDRD